MGAPIGNQFGGRASGERLRRDGALHQPHNRGDQNLTRAANPPRTELATTATELTRSEGRQIAQQLGIDRFDSRVGEVFKALDTDSVAGFQRDLSQLLAVAQKEGLDARDRNGVSRMLRSFRALQGGA